MEGLAPQFAEQPNPRRHNRLWKGPYIYRDNPPLVVHTTVKAYIEMLNRQQVTES